MRTVRVPEDGKNYDLPLDLGTFPLFNIQPFRHRLPPSIAAQGGLFLPMYRKSYLCVDRGDMWSQWQLRIAVSVSPPTSRIYSLFSS